MNNSPASMTVSFTCEPKHAVLLTTLYEILTDRENAAESVVTVDYYGYLLDTLAGIAPDILSFLEDEERPVTMAIQALADVQKSLEGR